MSWWWVNTCGVQRNLCCCEKGSHGQNPLHHLPEPWVFLETAQPPACVLLNSYTTVSFMKQVPYSLNPSIPSELHSDWHMQVSGTFLVEFKGINRMCSWYYPPCPAKNASKLHGAEADAGSKIWVHHFNRQVEGHCSSCPVIILLEYCEPWYSRLMPLWIKTIFMGFHVLTSKRYLLNSSSGAVCINDKPQRNNLTREQWISYLHSHIPNPSTSSNCKTSQNMPGESPQWGLWHRWSEHQKQSAAQIPVEILSVLRRAFLP